MPADRRGMRMAKSRAAAPQHAAMRPFGCIDHTRCAAEAIRQAERICADRALKLTPLRRQVLALLWRSHRPAGAYEILSALRRLHPNAEPPTVYRALAFLRAHGMVHRLASLNAFIGCSSPHPEEMAHFLICQRCGEVQEIQDHQIAQTLANRAADLGFQLADQVVELHGLCAQCH